VITPDPHLHDPATADDVFNVIRSAGLPLSVNNATKGPGPMIKRINADIGNWPLVITQFRSGAALRSATKWDASRPPRQGNPPFTFVGLNILIEFGPSTGALATPDAPRVKQAERLAAVLDPLLWPIEQRSVTPMTFASHGSPSASMTPAPSSAAAASSAP
jgi:hypothetical protein